MCGVRSDFEGFGVEGGMLDGVCRWRWKLCLGWISWVGDIFQEFYMK